MITNFKLFENKLEPSVGDYVFLHISDNRLTDDNLYDFLDNNIGQITSMREYKSYVLNKDDICVKYFNVPDFLKNSLKNRATKNGTTYYGYFSVTDIVVFAKTIDELKIKLNAKKYNI